MYYVNENVWQQLWRLIELKNLGDDLYDTATRIKENKEYEFDELNDFINNQPASGELIQLEILRYVHFYEKNFELEKEKRYVILSNDKRGDAVYYFNSKVRSVDCKYVDVIDLLYPDLGFTKENAEKLAEVVGGEIVEVKE